VVEEVMVVLVGGVVGGVMGVRVVVDAISQLEVPRARRVKEITAVGVQIIGVQIRHTVIRVEVVEERDR
jgi:hypothetical protein